MPPRTSSAWCSSWRTRPSRGIVSSADHTVNPEVERFGCTRAQVRRTVEIDAPHLVVQAHPVDVADAIAGAAAEVS